MIQEFVDRFMARRDEIEAGFSEEHPGDYVDIVRAVVRALRGDSEYDAPDPDRIHEINEVGYQGTLVYVIGAGGYQPSDYWYVKVGYGSCSGCDTLKSIREYESDELRVKDYMTLALHIVQGLKKMGDD